jgi:nickel-dependent lactate racemase
MPDEPSWRQLLGALDVEVVGPALVEPPGEDPRSVVERTLRASGLGRFLEDAERCHRPVTVVVNDPQRHTETRAAIDALLALGGGGGCSFRLLVATGSHTFAPAERRGHEELALGPWRARFAEIAWHDARAAPDLAMAGPHRFHRFVAGGEFVLGVGSLEPHYFAGCTGAHKTVTIGVMSLEDIEANHRRALSGGAAPLAFAGNPVFEGIASAVRHLESAGVRLLCLNEILVRGRLVGCTAGPPLAALEEGLPLVRRIFAHSLKAPADLIVACVEAPLDRTLYQADKGIKNVEAAVADGGVILLDAGCRGGVGPDRFLRLLERARSEAEAQRLIDREGYALGDHKAVRLRRLTGGRAVQIGIVSESLPEEAARSAHAVRFATRSAAASWGLDALRRAGGRSQNRRQARGLIVEEAGSMALSVTAREETTAA